MTQCCLSSGYYATATWNNQHLVGCCLSGHNPPVCTQKNTDATDSFAMEFIPICCVKFPDFLCLLQVFIHQIWMSSYFARVARIVNTSRHCLASFCLDERNYCSFGIDLSESLASSVGQIRFDTKHYPYWDNICLKLMPQKNVEMSLRVLHNRPASASKHFLLKIECLMCHHI